MVTAYIFIFFTLKKNISIFLMRGCLWSETFWSYDWKPYATQMPLQGLFALGFENVTGFGWLKFMGYQRKKIHAHHCYFASGRMLHFPVGKNPQKVEYVTNI